nr:MAG TPA: hypothetical protein [Crassvirales sp.]
MFYCLTINLKIMNKEENKIAAFSVGGGLR